MAASSTSQEALTSRAQTWYRSLPLVTKAVLTGCVAIYGVQLLAGFDNMGAVCMSPGLAFGGRWQLYRIFTSAIFHNGLLHIAFNMLAFVPMGQQLEQQLGSIKFGYIMLLMTLLESLVYTAATFALVVTRLHPRAATECAVGLSGTIFGLIVINSATSGSTHQSIFGLFQVPAHWYPWALLVFWQVIMPQASFVGHLSGVVVGQMWVWGWLTKAEMSTSLANRIEAFLAPCRRLGTVVPSQQLPTTVGSQPHASTPSAISDLSKWFARAQSYRIPGFSPGSDAAATGDSWRPPASSFKGQGRAVGSSPGGRDEESERQLRQDLLPVPVPPPSAAHGGQAPASEPANDSAALDPAARRAAMAAAAEARLQGALGTGVAR